MTSEPASVWTHTSSAATAPTLDEAHVWRAASYLASEEQAAPRGLAGAGGPHRA